VYTQVVYLEVYMEVYQGGVPKGVPWWVYLRVVGRHVYHGGYTSGWCITRVYLRVVCLPMYPGVYGGYVSLCTRVCREVYTQGV